MAVGGGGKIDQQVNAKGLQVPHRVLVLGLVTKDVWRYPEVFAEAEPQPQLSPVAGQIQPVGLLTRAEITQFIKNVVGGQQPFAGHQPPVACFHQGHGVVETLRLGFHHPRQQPQARGQLPAELVELAILFFQQGWAQQQVSGGVAPERQFRGEGQLGPLGSGLDTVLLERRAVAVEVTHQGVGLDQGDPHWGEDQRW
jgi:hypothetical protein